MVVSKSNIKASAKNITRTCNLSKGDGVVVMGGAHALRLLEEIAISCYKSGASPSILITSDRYMKRVFSEIPASTLATVPKQLVGMLKAADMLIMVEELEDPSIAESFPRAKLRARQQSQLPLQSLLSDPKTGKKWLYAGWPTPEAAKRYGIGYKQYEEIVIGGMTVSPDYLMKTGMKLEKKLRGATWAHVWDAKGTDFRVNIEGRLRNVDDGMISQKDYDLGDRGANLPAGELFIAPHETMGGGTIFCPITRDRMSNRLVEDVLLEFKDGMLLLDKVTARKNADALVSSFEECEAVDRTERKVVRTRFVGELGIGFNPRIKKSIGYILTDEKVAGTVHVAFGNNMGYGGTSQSTMHWDFVTAPGVSMDAERKDGKTIEVMRKGKFV
jgi:aminopeptidase